MTHVQGALVLALQAGAVEAQVVPVPNGEAFAVDVGRSRVAVHGTHLRVARVGEHVVVDLSEGVVSLGEAPRVGSTLGTLVTAPGARRVHRRRRRGDAAVTHDLAALRAPASLGLGHARPATGLHALAVTPAPRPDAADARRCPARSVHEGHRVERDPATPGSVPVTEVDCQRRRRRGRTIVSAPSAPAPTT